MAMTLITTNTESGDATSSFTSGIDSTYKLYIFKLIDMNPATDGVTLSVQFNASGQSGYNETMTTTYFNSKNAEGGGDRELNYVGDAYDQAEAGAYQYISGSIGNGADESAAGTLWLFNPSNTTYVTHFSSSISFYRSSDYALLALVGGFINVTAAIDDIDFKMSSGNFDGTITMYGVG